MTKEEVVFQDKFDTWEVRKRNKHGKVSITTENSPKPMTPSEALKYFNASAIQAIIG